MLRASPVLLLLTASCAAPAAVAQVELDCGSAIDAVDVPPATYTVFRGLVALDGSNNAKQALGTSTVDTGDPAAQLFAKTGLLVRSAKPFQLIVPPELQDRMSIEWGQAERTWQLDVPACDDEHEWLVFAGGYSVKDADCFTLRVSQSSEYTEARIGVGAPCPGQSPPP